MDRIKERRATSRFDLRLSRPKPLSSLVFLCELAKWARVYVLGSSLPEVPRADCLASIAQLSRPTRTSWVRSHVSVRPASIRIFAKAATNVLRRWWSLRFGHCKLFQRLRSADCQRANILLW